MKLIFGVLYNFSGVNLLALLQARPFHYVGDFLQSFKTVYLKDKSEEIYSVRLTQVAIPIYFSVVS
jgi:hypothetical protein